MAKIDQQKIPFWVHLDLTYRCNQACVHCCCQGLSRDFSWGAHEMGTYEIFALLDQLAAMGSLHLTLSGGEIFLREDLLDIAFYAKTRHFTIKLFTNGTLIDEDTAKELQRLSPVQVEMSIYGTTSDVHDAITRKPGSFAGLLRAVALLKKHNLRIELKSALMQDNYQESRVLRDFSLKLGADSFRQDFDISPKNDGSKGPLKYRITPVQLRELLARETASNGFPEAGINEPLKKPLCQAGSIGCYISPYGDLYPCPVLLLHMGNIRGKDFRQVWYGASQIRQSIAVLKTYEDIVSCRSCRYVSFCKNCLGMAQLETGNFKNCYPWLEEYAKTMYELSLASGKEQG